MLFVELFIDRDELTLCAARVFWLILLPTVGISTYGQFWLTKSDYYTGSEFSMLGSRFELYLALEIGRPSAMSFLVGT